MKIKTRVVPLALSLSQKYTVSAIAVSSQPNLKGSKQPKPLAECDKNTVVPCHERSHKIPDRKFFQRIKQVSGTSMSPAKEVTINQKFDSSGSWCQACEKTLDSSACKLLIYMAMRFRARGLRSRKNSEKRCLESKNRPTGQQYEKVAVRKGVEKSLVNNDL